MPIDLDDYFILIEKIDNFEDSDIDGWINSSKKPERLEKKMKKLAKFGGSFKANNYEVTSNDFTKIPFLCKDDDDNWRIQFGEARTVSFTPLINEDFNETCEEKSRISVAIYNGEIQNKEVVQNETSGSHESVKIEECVNEDFANKVTLNNTEEIIKNKKTKKSKKSNQTENIDSIKIEECVNENFVTQIAPINTGEILKNLNDIEISESVKLENLVNEDFVKDTVQVHDKSVTEIIMISESNNSSTIVQKASKKRKHSISIESVKEEEVVNDFIEVADNVPNVSRPKKKKRKTVVDNNIDGIKENLIDTTENVPINNNNSVENTEKKKKKKKSRVVDEKSAVVKKEIDDEAVENDMSIEANIPEVTTVDHKINNSVEITEKKKKKKKSRVVDEESAVVKKEIDDEAVENDMSIEVNIPGVTTVNHEINKSHKKHNKRKHSLETADPIDDNVPKLKTSEKKEKKNKSFKCE